MLLKAGNSNASVLVLCEDPKEDHFIKNTPILRQDLEIFAAACKSNKFRREDFMFLSCSDVVPVEFAGTDAKKRKYASKFSEEISTVVNGSKFSCVVTLGKVAASLLMKHEIKITQARGKREMIPDSNIPVYYMLSPSYVRMYPEHQELFFHDFYYLGKFRDVGYDVTKELVENKANYEWCEDLSPFLTDIKSAEIISLDTETTGLDWFKDDVVPLTVQMSFKEGHSLVCPVHEIYFQENNKHKLANLRLQIKEIVEDRTIKKVGHNLKYDYLILRKNGLGKMKGWVDDTLVMAFFADENMKDKSLDECARRWIPALAGYNDFFTYDKSKMIEVPKDDLITYGGGDTDATLRLYNVLKELISQDEKHYNCYRNLSFPAFRNLGVFVEPNGQKIDFCAMAELKKNFEDEMQKIYDKLIVMIPEKVKKEHTDKGKALSFSRPDFIRDVLFTKSGFGLKPVLATKSTKKLGKKDQIPSTDMKKHLSYFTDHPFVNDYIQYRKMSTIKTGFMNNFHKYVDKENKIHPVYSNAKVVTGRFQSQRPNGQNMPKRGSLAKLYRKIFVPAPGYCFIEADFSQAELRVAAVMANDKVMQKVYREGGDIHKVTGAAAKNIPMDKFELLPKDVKKNIRQVAKSLNFGLLYGMGVNGLKNYAKTDYGVDMSMEEAELFRNRFFSLYSGLIPWHKHQISFCKKHGYVRGLLGAKHTIPSIYSNDEYVRSTAERYAINYPVQRCASDLGAFSKSRVCADIDPRLGKCVGFVHDALIFEARIDDRMEVAAAVKWYMENQPLKEVFGFEFPIPIVADVSIGMENLSDMEEVSIDAVRPDWHKERFLKLQGFRL